MCQWGAYYRSLNGESYQSILGDDYTSISYTTIPVSGPTATPTPTLTPIPAPRPLGPWYVVVNQPFTLTWTSVGVGFTYLVTLLPPNSAFPTVRPISSSLTWSFPTGLALGTYTWTIQADNGSSLVSATLEVVNHVYLSYLPLVGN
jgi:hypothetical protein